jgi:modulator of FtsH protease
VGRYAFGMSDLYGGYAGTRAPARTSTATIFGQTMFLVGVAIAFLALGAVVGRDMALGTAQILSGVAFVMVLAQSFVRSLRYGALGITWLFGFALILGLGLGPVLNYYVQTDSDTVIQAAGGTAIITLGMGAYGLATSKDFARWMRPLGIAILVLLGITLIAFVVGVGNNPVLGLVWVGISAAILVVDFNYLRRHATEDDVVWLATGIFVSIVNIFLWLLNLLGGRN